MMPEAPVTKRGRKPGAAPVETRCTWRLKDGSQCKNTKTEPTLYCKIHGSKQLAISDGGVS